MDANNNEPMNPEVMRAQKLQGKKKVAEVLIALGRTASIFVGIGAAINAIQVPRVETFAFAAFINIPLVLQLIGEKKRDDVLNEFERDREKREINLRVRADWQCGPDCQRQSSHERHHQLRH